MADDDVGAIAEVSEILGGAMDRLGAPYPVVQFPRRDMGLFDVQNGMRIRHFVDTADLVWVRFADEHHLMSAGADEVPHDMQELRGKVLVNKQELQSDTLM